MKGTQQSANPAQTKDQLNSQNQQAQVSIGHYVFGIFKSHPNLYTGKSLGKGTFGKVKLATHTLTGEKVR